MNFVRNIDHFITRPITQLEGKPSKFLFVLNVGKDGNGSVYLGSDAQSGNHWTTCDVDMDKRIITYCDSPCPCPIDLLDWIGQYIQGTHNEQVLAYSFVYAYDPSSVASNGHLCGSLCASLYPLQRCGNVCGVVVLVVSAIACLANPFFSELATKHKQLRKRPKHATYLRDPTKYSKYLRLVLMSWFAEKRIDVSNVLPGSSGSALPSTSTKDETDGPIFVEDHPSTYATRRSVLSTWKRR